MSAPVNWLASSEQKVYFDKFKCPKSNGLTLKQFQDLLQETIYKHIDEKLSAFQASSNNNNNEKQQQNAARFSYQQELRLFRIFDTNNDHVIDFEEFSSGLCKHWLDKIFRRSCALLIVDLQNDFVDGSLALINGPAGQDSHDLIPIINNLIENYAFDVVIYTLDWHPPDHIGFYENLHMRKHKLKLSNNASQVQTSGSVIDGDKSAKQQSTSANAGQGYLLKKLVSTKAQLFDTVVFEEGQVEQKLWPVHCVQNSRGAELHPKLNIAPGAVKIYKGTLSNVDAYSAFWDNKRFNETGLRHELVTRQINDVYICGVALDYCVSASAFDSARSGFLTIVIEDACRGIDELEMKRRKSEIQNKGIILTTIDLMGAYVGFKEETENTSVNNKTLSNESSLEASKIASLELDICYQRAIIYEEYVKYGIF